MNAKRFIPIIIILILLLAACSSAAPGQTVVETVAVTQEVAGETVIQVVTATSESIFPVVEEVVAGSDAPGNPAQLSVIPPASRMVIKDAEMELLVSDTDNSLANVTQMAADYGGYLISSRTWFEDEYKFASLRLAIPATSFESALNNLRLLSVAVLAETATGQDVSAEYVDLQTRLTNLEATAARVRAFLEAAKTVEESLKVSAELSELEIQIETIKGQVRYFEGRTAFSTVTVLLTPQRPTPTPSPTPTATPSWSAGASFQGAGEQFVEVSHSAMDTVIWLLVVPGPFVLAVWLIGFVLRKGLRRGRRGTSAGE